jgi:hypothetical protein
MLETVRFTCRTLHNVQRNNFILHLSSPHPQITPSTARNLRACNRPASVIVSDRIWEIINVYYVCVQLYCVGFHCLSLHVSAYMAIFMCVGYFIFICLKDSVSMHFSAFFFHVVTLCMFPFVFFPLFSLVIFVCFFCLCLLASRQRHTQGNNKNNEGKQRKKHKWKHADCDHVKKKGR